MPVHFLWWAKRRDMSAESVIVMAFLRLKRTSLMCPDPGIVAMSVSPFNLSTIEALCDLSVEEVELKEVLAEPKYQG